MNRVRVGDGHLNVGMIVGVLLPWLLIGLLVRSCR